MGSLYDIGANYRGELGQGDTVDVTSLTQVGSDTTWSEINAGQLYVMAIKTDGTLWATGENGNGQLGLGDTTQITSFTQVGSLTTWSKIECGGWHTFAIKTDGTLWSTGRNNYGQLGLGDTTQRTSFTQVGSLTTWSDVFCGETHTFAIKTDGTLWSTGRNYNGQLGQGTSGAGADLTSFTQVGALTTWSKACGGKNHSLALKTDGTLWSTGYNAYGQLAQGDTTQRTLFTQIGALTTWSIISAGQYHSYAIKTDGTLWGAGANWYGELGVGDTSQKNSFTQEDSLSTSWTDVLGTDGFFALALQTKALYGTGKNNKYQLLDGTTTQRNSFTASTVTNAWKIAANSGNSVYDGSSYIIVTPLIPSRHRGNTSSGSVLFNGNQYVGDYNNGKIYKLDMDTYTDDGNAITRTRRTQIINQERNNVIHNKVEVDFEHGVGLDVAEGEDGENPQATLKWSDDEGNTWSNGISVDIGAYQQYGARAIWRRLGMSRNRIYELTIEEPVKVVITGSYADLKACRF
jgi:alpha-tubulin suppressor-like RCC1 family protein